MNTFDLNQVNKLVLKKHHLTEDDKIDDIIQITEDLCGLHSTEPKTSYLSLFVRTRNFTSDGTAVCTKSNAMPPMTIT